MDIALIDTRLSLPREGLIALRQARGARILCLAGCLWITQEGNLKDEVLRPGESLTVQRDGLTLITALTPSSVRLSDRSGKQCPSAWPAWLGAMSGRLRRWFGGMGTRNPRPC
ncbi:MAG TPA: DUF2917 domain-containing protein [Burkholderiales bacterium]|jgi:hypothetical protein|nr:DUF2917 domain-containing protein [Burkholderiales bacterium]